MSSGWSRRYSHHNAYSWYHLPVQNVRKHQDTIKRNGTRKIRNRYLFIWSSAIYIMALYANTLIREGYFVMVRLICCWGCFFNNLPCIWQYESSFDSFSFTLSLESSYILICNISVSFFSLVWRETWHTNWLPCRSNGCNLGIKKSKEFFIFEFHVVIYLKMNMDECICFSFDHPREKVLEYFYVFPMHTNEEGAIRSFYLDIDIFSKNIYGYTRSDDAQFSKKFCYKRKKRIFHRGYIK